MMKHHVINVNDFTNGRSMEKDRELQQDQQRARSQELLKGAVEDQGNESVERHQHHRPTVLD